MEQPVIARLRAKVEGAGFILSATGCPPRLVVEPADQLTTTQRMTVVRHWDDLLCDVLFPWVDKEPSLRIVRSLADTTLVLP